MEQVVKDKIHVHLLVPSLANAVYATGNKRNGFSERNTVEFMQWRLLWPCLWC